MNETKNKIAYIGVMALYGTTGIMKRLIPFSSNFVSFSRAVIATLFLLAVIIVRKRKVDFKAVRANLPFLIIVGILLGVNWIAFFEACTYTTVAKATLCYYMAPVIVILISPFIYKEKLGIKKIACVAAAIIGMIMVSGVLTDSDGGDYRGIIIGLAAAVMYSLVIVLSRRIKDMDSYDKTVVQLFVAAVALLPAIIFGGEISKLPDATAGQWIILFLIGILNTGIAYIIYFATMPKLKAHTVAIFAYADPVVSILLSALLLKEPMGAISIIGAVLIIGAMIISEL